MVRSALARKLALLFSALFAVILLGLLFSTLNNETTAVLASTSQEQARAQPDIYLVKDVNPLRDSRPRSLTNFNNRLFLAAENENYTIDLWSSDGTVTGTVMITGTIARGYEYDPEMIAFKNKLYIFTDYRVWMTDGTPEGSEPLTPPVPHRIASANLLGDRLVFFTIEADCFRVCWDQPLEMWTSDGTVSGTTHHGAISPRSGSFSIRLGRINNILYFSAYTYGLGYELWRSDGTLAGTYMVKDISPGFDSSSPNGFTVMNNTLYFWANLKELWKSDGTITGTVRVISLWGSGIGEVGEIESVGGKLYFGAGEIYAGFGLWTSDGTEAGTVLFKPYDLVVPANLTNVNGTLYYTVNDDVHGIELWKSDGSQAGTLLVKDILPGSDGSSPHNLTAIGSNLYFAADDGVHGIEAWISDGTEAGTYLLSDIQAGADGSLPADFTLSAGRLFFSAQEVLYGRELWALDFHLVPRMYLPLLNRLSGQ